MRWGIYLTYLFGVVWCGIWAYGYFRVGPIGSTATVEEIWVTYYPEWHTSGTKQFTKPDSDIFHVLLLGGSVLEQLGPELEKSFSAALGRRTRIFNMAKSAHTSRDSLNKYRLVRDKPFDLIILYDGINDVRMNCCPPGTFRDDYSHCSWYRSVERRVREKRFNFTDLVLEDAVRLTALVPNEQTLDFGAEIKTPAAFRKNVEEILSSCEAVEQPVMLMTFAYHLPSDYSRERFERQELDYGRGRFELSAELWGRPANLIATLDQQNQVVKELASQRPKVLFFDLQETLPKNGTLFSDVCHLTEAGCIEVSRRIVDQYLQLVRQKTGNDSE